MSRAATARKPANKPRTGQNKNLCPAARRGFLLLTAAQRAGRKFENGLDAQAAQKTRNIKLLTYRFAGHFPAIVPSQHLFRVGMGITDLKLDILDEMREYVADLPRRKRREAFFELARDFANGFLESAQRYDPCVEDRSSSSEREANDSAEPARPSPSKLRRLS